MNNLFSPFPHTLLCAVLSNWTRNAFIALYFCCHCHARAMHNNNNNLYLLIASHTKSAHAGQCRATAEAGQAPTGLCPSSSHPLTVTAIAEAYSFQCTPCSNEFSAQLTPLNGGITFHSHLQSDLPVECASQDREFRKIICNELIVCLNFT